MVGSKNVLFYPEGSVWIAHKPCNIFAVESRNNLSMAQKAAKRSFADLIGNQYGGKPIKQAISNGLNDEYDRER